MKYLHLIFAGLILLSPINTGLAANLQPVAGLTLFGGAERGSDKHASGIGGAEILGLYPLGPRFGLQGSLLNQGGHGGYRLGVSAGPVYAYDSGKIGLFGDYVFKDRGSNNFFYLRGVLSHYFENFDFVLSYSHPVHRVQRDSHKFSVQTTCGADPEFETVTIRTPVASLNELKAVVRYYPTQKMELNAGLLVNGFAGPHRNVAGTGFGGVFGAAFQVADWLIVRPIQAQMDTRERYRITSGVELVWTPLQQYERSRAEGRDATFAAGAAPAAPSGVSC